MSLAQQAEDRREERESRFRDSVVNDGGTAFPNNGVQHWRDTPGMSLRDWFVGQLMASGRFGSESEDTETLISCAERAYQLADILIAAREGTKP
jgi:hypothetical protein